MFMTNPKLSGMPTPTAKGRARGGSDSLSETCIQSWLELPL